MYIDVSLSLSLSLYIYIYIYIYIRHRAYRHGRCEVLQAPVFYSGIEFLRKIPPAATHSSGLPLTVRNSSGILRYSVRYSDGGTSERGRLPEVISLSSAPEIRNPEMLINTWC